MESSKELKELEDSDSLGILERQILCELKAEAELIRREKWAAPQVRRSLEEELSDWSDEDRRQRSRRRSYTADRSVAVSLNRRRQKSATTRRSRSCESDQSESEEEQPVQGRRPSRVKKEDRIPVYEDYVFLCQQWLSSDEGDKQIVRELVCQDKKVHYKD